MKKHKIFETTDPEGRTISLHKDTWAHIKQKHPEVKTTVSEVKLVIQRPDVITEISKRQSLAYTKTTSTSLYFNIYAKMDDTYQKGNVRTAFLQTRAPKGEVIWIQKT